MTEKPVPMRDLFEFFEPVSSIFAAPRQCTLTAIFEGGAPSHHPETDLDV